MIPAFDEALCTDCGGCVGVCPVDAVELMHGHVDITDACIECDLCVRVCPTGALTSDTWPPDGMDVPAAVAADAGKRAPRTVGDDT